MVLKYCASHIVALSHRAAVAVRLSCVADGGVHSTSIRGASVPVLSTLALRDMVRRVSCGGW
jgi:hypothetical protein